VLRARGMAERKVVLYSTSAGLYYRAVKNERVIPPEISITTG
jgi:hypothetical protein